MADFSKMKRKGLGTPPSFDEAATSLNSSEIAPDPGTNQVAVIFIKRSKP